VVIVLAIGPEVRGFRHSRRHWIVKGDNKVRSVTSFGGDVKQSAPSRKIYGYFSPSSLCFATRCLCWHLSESSGG
jgi:hypothetical protein